MEIKAVWLGLIVAASCVLPGTVSAADASNQNESGQKMESCKQMMAERDSISAKEVY